MAQALDYSKIASSCNNLTSLANNMQTVVDKLYETKTSIASGWEGDASDAYIKELTRLASSLNDAKQTLAMSVLFLSGVSDGYQSIDKNTKDTLINLIGGQSSIDSIDINKLNSVNLYSRVSHQSFEKKPKEISTSTEEAVAVSTNRSYSNPSISRASYATSAASTAVYTYSSSSSNESKKKEEPQVTYDIPKSTYTGPLDMNNYPTGKNIPDAIERATLVAKYLVENGGFSPIQAAAMVGVYIDENYCDPGSYMQAEKNGQGASGTGGNGYGAGIGSWTFESYKNQCLNDAGYPSGTPIESLSLQQQCDMIIAMSQKSNKVYFDALKRCDNIEDASATACIITGGVGFSKNWSTHPTIDEAKYMSDYYGRANDRSFGASPYHWNLYDRRLEYAKKVYERLLEDSNSSTLV